MRKALQAWMLAAALVPAALVGQDLNVTRPAVELERLLAEAPMRIVSAEISRPKAKGDITLKADVAFGDEPPMRVKLRKSMPGADEFNNVPRYDLAAQELQKLLVDPVDYFVPPTALRFVPIDELRRYTDDVRPTFRGSDEVLDPATDPRFSKLRKDLPAWVKARPQVLKELALYSGFSQK